MNYKLVALLFACMVAVSLTLKGFDSFGENGLTAGEWIGSILFALVFAIVAWWVSLHAMQWLVRKGHLPEGDD